MKIVLELEGNIPSKKNSRQVLRPYSRFGRSQKRVYAPSDAYKGWHEYAKLQLMKQLGDNDNLRHSNLLPITKCQSITVEIFYGNDRRRDNTNVVESVHDLLVDYVILKDDCWQITGETRQIPVFRHREPGCRITIITPDDDGRPDTNGGQSKKSGKD